MSLSKLILYIVLITGGLSWIPVARLAGVDLVVENVGRLAAVALFGLILFRQSHRIRIDIILVLLLAWICWTTLAMAAHSGFAGMHIMRMWALEVALAFALLNLRADSQSALRSAAIISTLVMLFALILSADKAGVPLLKNTLQYLATFNRDFFMSQTVRPLVNAFAGTGGTSEVYTGTQINKISGTFVLLFAILVFSPRPRAPLATALWLSSVVLSFSVVTVLFSSSAMVILVLTLAFLLWRYAANYLYIFVGALIPIAALLVYFGGDTLWSFLAENVAADANTRLGRMYQYERAWALINAHPLLGTGFRTFDGSPVHNWLMFSWLSAGIFALALALATYFAIIRIVYQIFRYTPNHSDNWRLAALITTLVSLFVIRTLIGGGGGIGGGAGMVALALALFLFQNVFRASQRRNQFPSQTKILR